MFGLHLWENIFHFSQITPKILDGCGEELKNWTKTWRPHNMGCAFPLYEVYEISAVHSGESIFVSLSNLPTWIHFSICKKSKRKKKVNQILRKKKKEEEEEERNPWNIRFWQSHTHNLSTRKSRNWICPNSLIWFDWITKEEGRKWKSIYLYLHAEAKKHNSWNRVLWW